MKKKFIFAITLIAILVICCMILGREKYENEITQDIIDDPYENSSTDFPKEDNTVIPEASDSDWLKASELPEDDILRQLKIGMTYEEVTGIVGDLGLPVGNGSWSHEKKLADGRVISVTFSWETRELISIRLWIYPGPRIPLDLNN